MMLQQEKLCEKLRQNKPLLQSFCLQPLPWPKSVDAIHQRQTEHVVVVVAVAVVGGDATCDCQRDDINWQQATGKSRGEKKPSQTPQQAAVINNTRSQAT